MALARSISNRAIESAMLNNLGDIERFLGNHAVAFEHYEAVRRVCREIGQRASEAYVLCNMAHVSLVRGDPVGSLDWASEARRSAEHLSDRDLEASLSTVCGHAHAALGRDVEAAVAYREAAAMYREIGRPTMPPEPIAGLARLALARGGLVEAHRLVADIVTHFDAGGTVDGTEDPLWIYLTCHQVLVAAESPRAFEFLERAHTLLMERADRLEPGEREPFLANVPSHRAIVKAWGAREGAVHPGPRS